MNNLLMNFGNQILATICLVGTIAYFIWLYRKEEKDKLKSRIKLVLLIILLLLVAMFAMDSIYLI